jgi:phosphoribosylglycinamide formyltransferase-1
VTFDLDGGPAVLQASVEVRADDDEARLAARVLAREHVIFPRVIGWIAEGRLTCPDGQPKLDGHPLDAPLQDRSPDPPTDPEPHPT